MRARRTSGLQIGSTRSRAGVVLVLFCLIVVGIMAMAAMILDLGVARLTQSQMQNAVDGVAVDVMRERDRARTPGAEGDEEEAAWRRDSTRRGLNRRQATWQYRETLEAPSEQDLEEAIAPGAYVDLEGGDDSLSSGQTITGVGWSEARLETNYEPVLNGAGDVIAATALNAREGDIVSGAFTGEAGEGAFGYGDNPRDLEHPDYSRADFVPAAPEEAPFQEGVLVRLRRTRTGTDQDVDIDEQPQISSTGPTLPLLFGRGTMIQGDAEHAGYSPRRTGLPVRATAIARAAPAVRVGPPMDEATIAQMQATVPMAQDEADLLRIGAAPFGWRDSFWVSSAVSNGGFPFWRTGSDGLLRALVSIRAQEDPGTGIVIFKLFWVDPDVYQQGNVDDAEDSGTVIGSLYPEKTVRVGDKLLSGERWCPPGPCPCFDADEWAACHIANGGYVSFWESFLDRPQALVPVFWLRWVPGEGNQQFPIGFVRVKTEIARDSFDLDGDGDYQEFVVNTQGVPLMVVTKLPNVQAPGMPWIAPRNASATFDGLQTDEEDLPQVSVSGWDPILLGFVDGNGNRVEDPNEGFNDFNPPNGQEDPGERYLWGLRYLVRDSADTIVFAPVLAR